MKTNICLIIVIVILSQSCITIKESSLRSPDTNTIKIGDCEISSSGAVYMNMLSLIKTDFMPGSIRIKMNDMLIYADPLIVDDTSKANYIFVTHNHLDHFSKPDIRKLTGKETIIIGPEIVTKKLKDHQFRTISPGDTIDFGEIKCEVVESYNIDSKIHRKGNNNVGYIISCDTIRIYIAGDTDFIPEMKGLENITVALLPIGEGKTAMDPVSASVAAKVIKPGIVIPIHYELGQNREKDFMELINKDIEVRLFQE